ncbi:MAG: pyridoxal-phosphate dependent enzyme [Pseudomonadota bacterium]
MRAGQRLSAERIAAASSIIDPCFLNSPQFVCAPLCDALGVETVLKVETLNPVRCFKGRGADLYMATLEGEGPLMCASAGNFGQALAYAAGRRGLPLTVYASVSANPLKVERMRALGATVVLEGEDFDGAKAAAKRNAGEAHFVEDGKEVAISEGAGTIAVELAAVDGPLDAVVVPLGNGALLSGIGAYLRHERPNTAVIGVVAEGAPAMALSWRQKRVVETERADTIADGIGVRVPVPEALDDLEGLIDDIVAVDDGAILSAMGLAHRYAGLVVEPAGAAGLAAIAGHQARFAGQRVATVLCGGNVSFEDMDRWFSSPL